MVPGYGFWRRGGRVLVQGRFQRELGVVAGVAGIHTANVNSSESGPVNPQL